MARRPIERSELKAALERVFDLATRDQLELFQALRNYLGGEVAAGEEVKDRQIEERAQALAAIGAVARKLKLPKDKAPTATQFRELAGDAAPGWNVSRIARAFGRWRLAQRVYLGEPLAQTAAQRDIKRKEGRNRSRSTEDFVAGVRQWLKTKPKVEDQSSYDRWAGQENQRRKKDGEPRVVAAERIRKTLALPWETILEVAKGKLSLAEARKTRAQELGQSRFVGMRYAALVLGWAERDALVYSKRGDFPRPVAKIANFRVWEKSDIDAFAAGKPFPQRQAMGLQKRFLTRSQLAKELKLNPGFLSTLVHRQRWDRVPQPSGKIGTYHYWWREDLEKWRKAQPR